jgi:hypothetical protein
VMELERRLRMGPALARVLELRALDPPDTALTEPFGVEY